MSCKAAILVLFNFSSARKGEEAAAARDLFFLSVKSYLNSCVQQLTLILSCKISNHNENPREGLYPLLLHFDRGVT